MAKIPIYNAQVGLTKQAPATTVDASAYGQQARAMGGIGDALFKIGEKMKQVQSDAEADQAIILASNMSNEAELEASQEQWSSDYETNNQKRLDNIRNTVLATVKDPVALQKVNNWLDLNLSNSQIKMKQYGYQKLIATRKEQLDNRLYDNEQLILNSTGSQKQQYIDERYNIYQEGISGGVWTKADAELNIKKDKAELVNKQAKWDIYNDQSIDENKSAVLSNLKDRSQYQGLTDEDRLKLIKEEQTRIAQNLVNHTNRVKDVSEKRFDNIINKFIDDTLTFQDLEQERNVPEEDGGLSPKKIDEFINKLNTKQEARLKPFLSDKEAKSYNNFILKYIDNSFDRHRAMELLVDAYSDGNLEKSEANVLNKLRKYTKDIEWNRQSGFIKFGIERLKRNFGMGIIPEPLKESIGLSINPTDQEISQRIKEYLNNVGKGMTPIEASDRAISTQIEIELNKAANEVSKIYSEENINYTMQQRNMTRQEVLDALGIKEKDVIK